ncbi:MAG TPA: hypothetical protein VIH95_07255 [Acidimicrobiales bacterium]
MTFASPGLSFGGALTANTTVKSAASVLGTGTGCSATPIGISIPSATTACPQTAGVPTPTDPSACLASKTKSGITTYAIAAKPNYYNTTASYATAGVANLAAALAAKPLKTTVDNIPLVLMYGAASQITPGGVCGANDDVGFYLTGNATVKGLTVATYTDTTCLVSDTGTGTTGDFFADLTSPSTIITGATIGGASNLTVTFPNSSCSAAGTVTFASPGLSFGGALTANTSVKTAASVVATGAGCSATPIGVSIPSTTTACPQTAGVPTPTDPSACLASKTKSGITTYAIAAKPNYYDTTASYATSGVADLAAALLAKPLKTTIDNVPMVLNYGAASQITPGGVCGANDQVGFYLTGNATIKGLTIGTYTQTTCLVSDTGTGTTGDFFADLTSPSTIITGAVIGGASNLTLTFG